MIPVDHRVLTGVFIVLVVMITGFSGPTFNSLQGDEQD